MPNPTKNLVLNGGFTETVPGTGTSSQDFGDPAHWISTETDERQIQTLGRSNARFMFDKFSSPGASLSQTVSGIEPNGETITFRFDYIRYQDQGTSSDEAMKVRITVTGSRGDVPVDILMASTRPPTSYSFGARSSSYEIKFTNVSDGKISQKIYFDNVSLVAPVPCFTAGTLIATPSGERLIETLMPGDMVTTQDHGPQPIRWIGRRTIHFDSKGILNGKLRPIRIKTGALGSQMPAKDLLVSPQHRMLLRNNLAQRMFNINEVLTAAKHLLGMPGIEVVEDVEEITYLHILLDNHAVILANGAWSETLYLGEQALNSLSAEQREEISEIFPKVATEALSYPFAREVIKGSATRKFIARCQKNAKKLVELKSTREQVEKRRNPSRHLCYDH